MNIENPIQLIVLLATLAITAILWSRSLKREVNRRTTPLRNELLECKKLQEALRESETRYRSILNASPDDITITDLNGIILMVSPAAVTMFGYDRAEEGCGRLVTDFIAPEDRARVLTNFTLKKTRGDMAKPDEYRGFRKDGSTFDIEVNSDFIRGDDGQPTGIVFIVRDTTVRKQTEHENARLQALNQQLQKHESLNRMAGSIAHHFNNQLGAVLGNLELVIEEMSQNGSPSRKLLNAEKAALKAAEISGLMLTYLGYSTSEQSPLDLSEVCRQSLPLLKAATPGNIAFEVDLPSPGPVITANANQIQQVLTNLVTNAWEAVGENQGVVSVKVGMISADTVSAAKRFPVDWQSQNLNYATLEVKDTGCGIADEDLDKLFDPFFSSKFTGRGLGLPVVLGIIKAHEGIVEVESKAGRGSIFRVLLPIATEAQIEPC
jgi:two-component system cell cycle sensor histidine kinase/response regulator CckA